MYCAQPLRTSLGAGDRMQALELLPLHLALLELIEEAAMGPAEGEGLEG